MAFNKNMKEPVPFRTHMDTMSNYGIQLEPEDRVGANSTH